MNELVIDQLVTARFWSKVAVGDEDECWPWLAGTHSAGYGDFKIGNKSVTAHRTAYVIFTGCDFSAIEKLVVRHSCDNPCCCNPFHLSTGSHRDNVMDRVSRKRSAVGEGNGRHKLTEAEVLAIRADKRPQSVIAADYGVTKWCIQAVKQRVSWKHLA